MSDFSPEADLLVAAFQLLPIAVITTDVRGVVRSVNTSLTSLTGYAAEEAVGQPITMLSFGTKNPPSMTSFNRQFSLMSLGGESGSAEKDRESLHGRTDRSIDQEPKRRDPSNCGDNRRHHRT